MITNRNLQKIKGTILLFSVVACFGFGLWTLYLTVIFGDPLFWMKYYAIPSVETTSVGQTVEEYSQAKPFFVAVWQYFKSVTWMAGIIPMIYAVIGVVVLSIRMIRKWSWDILPLFLPASIFLFMVLTLQRNTPLVQPDLSLANILSSETSKQTGFNIRYGLMVFPWIVLLSTFAFDMKSFYFRFILFLIFFIQLLSYVYPKYSVIYQIPQSIRYGKPYTDIVEYMKKNYDSGLILVSASGFEDQMFQMGFDYKTYIHEGAGLYWKESLDHPARYAAWIITDFNHPTDMLARELKNKPYWSWFYSLVYDSPSAKIYKIKDKPDLEIAGSNIYTAPSKKPSQFVVPKGHELINVDKTFRFIGVNSHDLVYLPEKEMEEIVRLAKENGVKVIRFWGFGEGIANGFQPDAGKFNDETFDKLAYVLAVLDVYDIKAIVTLGNYWKDYGGVPMYLQWDGLPNQTPEDWDKFFTNKFVKLRYRTFIEKILNYESKYSGKKLKDDPAVLAWELMNEPRSSTAEKSGVVLEWLTEMAKLVKSIDKNHLVLAGTEGFTELYNAGGYGPSFEQVAALPEIDAATAHYYSEWNSKNIDLTDLIVDWANQAQIVGKPFIFEEIGFDKRSEENDGVDRSVSYENMFKFVRELNESDQLDVDGLLLWNWALKLDENYGISPTNPKDRDILKSIQFFSFTL